MGLNKRPSTRCKVKIGRYAVMMMPGVEDRPLHLVRRLPNALHRGLRAARAILVCEVPHDVLHHHHCAIHHHPKIERSE